MSNQQATQAQQQPQEPQQLMQQQLQQLQDKQQMESIKNFFNGESIKARFTELLGKEAPKFLMSVLQVVSSNKDLSRCDIQSIYNAAATAAILNLSIDKNLQHAAIIPYNDKHRGGMQVAQFQIMWKGFVQLAERTGKFKTINVVDVRKGELKSQNRLTDECEFVWVQDDDERDALPIVGFAAYFELLNGFSKTRYRSVKQLQKHAKKYSKTYDRQDGKWNTDFEAMCAKTVIKELLGKWAPLETSSTLGLAIKADQAVSMREGEYDYPDNPIVDAEAEQLSSTTNSAANSSNNSKADAAIEQAQKILANRK